jgi:hypothetical protein
MPQDSRVRLAMPAPESDLSTACENNVATLCDVSLVAGSESLSP